MKKTVITLTMLALMAATSFADKLFVAGETYNVTFINYMKNVSMADAKEYAAILEKECDLVQTVAAGDVAAIIQKIAATTTLMSSGDYCNAVVKGDSVTYVLVILKTDSQLAVRPYIVK